MAIQKLMFKMLLYSYKIICYQQNTLTQSTRHFEYVSKNTFSVWSKSCDLTDIFQGKSVLSFSYWHSFVLKLNWISHLQPWLIFYSFTPFSSVSNFLPAYIFSQLSVLSTHPFLSEILLLPLQQRSSLDAVLECRRTWWWPPLILATLGHTHFSCSNVYIHRRAVTKSLTYYSIF